MELKSCTPVLFVKDAKKARDFYVNILKLTVVADFGELNFIFKEGFAIWQILEENIITKTLGSENIYNSTATSRFELVFETDNLNEVYNTLKEQGVKFLHEVNEEIWGQKNIRFYDYDGHLVEVGESMYVFLKRMYDEEKSIEGVARRAYMQPDMVRQILGK